MSGLAESLKIKSQLSCLHIRRQFVRSHTHKHRIIICSYIIVGGFNGPKTMDALCEQRACFRSSPMRRHHPASATVPYYYHYYYYHYLLLLYYNIIFIIVRVYERRRTLRAECLIDVRGQR